MALVRTLNPALTARALLFLRLVHSDFCDNGFVFVDGFTGATLSAAVTRWCRRCSISVYLVRRFLRFVPVLLRNISSGMCLVRFHDRYRHWLLADHAGNAAFGALVVVEFLYAIGSSTNPMFELCLAWHLVSGGFAFGMALAATDPAMASMTTKGKYIYGFLIGVMSILVRSLNPALPMPGEGFYSVTYLHLS